MIYNNNLITCDNKNYNLLISLLYIIHIYFSIVSYLQKIKIESRIFPSPPIFKVELKFLNIKILLCSTTYLR